MGLGIGRIASVVCCCFALLSAQARADIGTVVQLSDPEVAPTPTPSATPVAPAISETAAAPEPDPSLSDIEMPWLLSTPAGPTAFVLDRQRFEMSIPLDRVNQIAWSSFKTQPLFLAAFGLTNSITLNIGAGVHSISAGMRFNFLNTELWSFSAEPSIGYQYRPIKTYYSEEGAERPLMLTLAASRVIDARNKLHFTATGVMSKTSYHYGYNSYVYDYRNKSYTMQGYSNDSETRAKTLRLSAGYERRVGRIHALSFWLATELAQEEESGSYSGYSYGYNNSNVEKSLETSPRLGVGYQLLIRRFIAGIGVELGPNYKSRSNSSVTYSYANRSSFNIVGANVVAGLGYRL